MLGKEKALAVLRRALELSVADKTEVRISGENFNLTRFANSTIHQNLNRDIAELQVRVIHGNRLGVASTYSLDEEGIKAVLAKAMQLAAVGEESGEELDLPPKTTYAPCDNYYAATANYTAGERAEDVAKIVAHCDPLGYKAFGSHITTTEELAVMNSNGLEAYNVSTYAYLRTVVEGPSAYGYADMLSRNVEEIDADAIGKEAVERCKMAQNPVPLATGEYDVVFLPYAVADIVRFPAYIGFVGQPYEEKRSFMAKYMGKKIMGDNISIWDDAADLNTLNMPFDLEGVAKKRVNIIENGVAKGVVYNYSTAKRYGKEPTGHVASRRGMTFENPASMIMANGDSSVEEMIKATKKGLLVTRFHYTHCPEPGNVVMTGTTRDGLFLIEDGEIKHSVMNMRLTDSVLEMLSRVDMISKDRKLQRDWWSTFTSYLPAIRVKNVKWTGATLF